MPIVGTQQSPIEIEHDRCILPADPEKHFAIHPAAWTPSGPLPGTYGGDNFGFAPPSASLAIAGKSWTLRKIHMHDGLEHILDLHGSSTPKYECHLLHSAPDDPGARGPKLVLATFFNLAEKAKPRPSIEKLNKRLAGVSPRTVGARSIIPDLIESAGSAAADLDPLDFMPEPSDDPSDPYRNWKRWYCYQGSLTSDPFSEDVTWIVLEKTFVVDRAHFDQLAREAHQHSRKPMPLDRRFVLKSFE